MNRFDPAARSEQNVENSNATDEGREGNSFAIQLGVDDYWYAHLRIASMNERRELTLGRVSLVHRDGFHILDTRGEQKNYNINVPGHCVESALWPPVVGDWVGLANGRIAAILPRRTFLSRPSVSRGSTTQAIAANVDIVGIVEPVKPTPAIGRIERFTTLALAGGSRSWLLLSKTDLEEDRRVEELSKSLGQSCDAVFPISRADDTSLAQLRRALQPGQTVVFVGRSGAGKSTLLNSLAGTDLPTAAVRSVDMKGRHTTTSRQLIVTPHAVVIDTPGIRALGVSTETDALNRAFADIAELATGCRFVDCSHTSEPDCAVLAAIHSGTLDPDRLDRFQALRRESAHRARRQDSRIARADQRRRSRDNTRGRRDAMRRKGKRR